MRKIWNSFKICFSMFSKIPMPQSEWTEENMKYMMIFFPFIGMINAAVMFGFADLMNHYGVADSNLFRCVVIFLIPLIITGGIHFDGFLDVSDAMSSWKEREQRIEILKDPHAGAFAIIRGLMFTVLYIGAVSMLETRTIMLLIPLLTFNRAVISITVVTWKKLSSKGTVSLFSKSASEKIVIFCSVVIATAALLTAECLNWKASSVCVCGFAAVFLYYRRFSSKYFDGINGDLSGWFNEVSELLFLLLLACLTIVLGGSLWN